MVYGVCAGCGAVAWELLAEPFSDCCMDCAPSDYRDDEWGDEWDDDEDWEAA